LKDDGFGVLWKRRVPANDGGVALGQAVIAAAMLDAEIKNSRSKCKMTG